MATARRDWMLGGLATGLAGLATSYVAAAALTIRESPVVAVAEWIIRLTPGNVAETAIRLLEHLDKPALITGILLFLLVAFAVAGIQARHALWRGLLVFAALTLVGAVAVTSRTGAAPLDLVPLLVGFATWWGVLSWVAGLLHRHSPAIRADADPGATALSRRGVLLQLGAVVAASAALGVLGRLVGRGRRQVEATRELVRLDGVSNPVVPQTANVGLRGVTPWRTPNSEFYLIHTAITAPSIDPTSWRLRIHGMVDRELVVTYQDLLDRQLTEAWVTLNCVSNPVGGDLIGNAWWSGVRVAELLAEAGVRPGADAVLQTSQDGWTCGTPLAALTDDRAAMLAVGMNGAALPIDHGFPVRTIVPGLYGFVSACKWVVDMEVSRFADFSAYWTDRGWAEQAPVKMSSRIDVPRSGASVPAGQIGIGGVAWAQHTGISGVEVSVDGGRWLPAMIGPVPTPDTWVQWKATVEVAPGDHRVRVRAIDEQGTVQTGVVRDVVPDGATGWDEVEFTAEA